jgi:hypothetical protein
MVARVDRGGSMPTPGIAFQRTHSRRRRGFPIVTSKTLSTSMPSTPTAARSSRACARSSPWSGIRVGSLPCLKTSVQVGSRSSVVAVMKTVVRGILDRRSLTSAASSSAPLSTPSRMISDVSRSKVER